MALVSYPIQNPYYASLITYNSNDPSQNGNGNTTSKNISSLVNSLYFQHHFGLHPFVVDPRLILTAQSLSRPGEIASKPPEMIKTPLSARASSFIPTPKTVLQKNSSSSGFTPPISPTMEMPALPPPTYFRVVDCTENNLKETIVQVASFVSKMYSVFPRLEKEQRQQLRERRILINDPYTLPSFQKCIAFEHILTLKIVHFFDKMLKNGGPLLLLLRTHFHPEDELASAAEIAFAQSKYDLSPLFPYNTLTKIGITYNRTKLIVEMNFKTEFSFDKDR